MEGDESRQCEYVVARKKRRCRMQLKEGRRFCGEHDPATLPCPLDPKHSVHPAALHKHLQKCNAQLPQHPHILHNCNLAQPGGDEACSAVHRSGGEKVVVSAEVLARVEGVVVEEEEVDVEELAHLSVEEYTSLHPLFGPLLLKHLRQQSSILQHMHNLNLISNSTHQSTSGSGICYAELGAGRGQLGSWLSNLICPDDRILLVDHAGVRRKFENRLPNFHEDSSKFQRIRCGIQHLDLTAVDCVKTCSGGLVGFWKHLCGDATDIGLRCLVNGMAKGMKIVGLACVPCCHHKLRKFVEFRSSWREYVGKEYLLGKGLGEKEFEELRVMCSWAVCGLSSEGSRFKEEGVEGLSVQRMEEMGRKAKFILQYGRKLYLEKNLGVDVRIVHYVPTSVTPENVMLIANTTNP